MKIHRTPSEGTEGSTLVKKEIMSQRGFDLNEGSLLNRVTHRRVSTGTETNDSQKGRPEVCNPRGPDTDEPEW